MIWCCPHSIVMIFMGPPHLSLLSFSLADACHTVTKLVGVTFLAGAFLVWFRNALLPVLRCDPAAQEAVCSCTTFPTVTAALNGRMSCFDFPREALSEARHCGKVHWPPEGATKQGGYAYTSHAIHASNPVIMQFGIKWVRWSPY